MSFSHESVQPPRSKEQTKSYRCCQTFTNLFIMQKWLLSNSSRHSWTIRDGCMRKSHTCHCWIESWFIHECFLDCRRDNCIMRLFSNSVSGSSTSKIWCLTCHLPHFADCPSRTPPVRKPILHLCFLSNNHLRHHIHNWLADLVSNSLYPWTSTQSGQCGKSLINYVLCTLVGGPKNYVFHDSSLQLTQCFKISPLAKYHWKSLPSKTLPYSVFCFIEIRLYFCFATYCLENYNFLIFLSNSGMWCKLSAVFRQP